VIHPIPPGTRDVLPDEMRELRELSQRLHAAFEGAGYGEVWTPALEYEDVLRKGDDRAAGAGYRLFDEHGQVLALRSDMTIPIARMVASRYAEAEPPLRLCYFAHAYRETRGAEQPREFLQGGVELIGPSAPEGDAEVVALTVAALDDAGLRRHRIGIGDGSLYRALLGSLGVPTEHHLPLLERLARRDLAGLSMQVAELGLRESERDLLTRLPEMRGGREVLDQAGEAVSGLRELHDLLEQRGVADRVIFDLGLVRDLGYYTGAVFEVYDPAVGFALGGGGRYDELLGRFGRDLSACGIALDVQRVHVAQAAEERLA
jgi:ATP phosphoribosyltransferase regulatory subunit